MRILVSKFVRHVFEQVEVWWPWKEPSNGERASAVKGPSAPETLACREGKVLTKASLYRRLACPNRYRHSRSILSSSLARASLDLIAICIQTFYNENLSTPKGQQHPPGVAKNLCVGIFPTRTVAGWIKPVFVYGLLDISMGWLIEQI